MCRHRIAKWRLRWLTWQGPASDKMVARQHGHHAEHAAAAPYITQSSALQNKASHH
ncbi:hypothetical protein STEG23_017969, partial [Scotinomys teguina]